MSLVPFGDIYKPVKDYFTKFYNTSSFALEGKCKTGSEGTQLQFNPKYNRLQDGNSTTEVEFEQSSDMFTWAKTVGKLNINASGKMKVELKLKEINHLKGVTLTGVADINTPDNSKDAFEGHVEFRHNDQLLLLAKSRILQSLELAAVAAPRKGTLIGGTVTLNKSFGLQDYNLGGSLKNGAAQFAWNFDKNATVKFGGLYTTPEKVVFGSEATISSKDLGITLGAQANIRGATWRAKINNKGVVGLSAQAKLNDNLTATVSTEVDSKKSVGSKLGVKFEWVN
jgi:hypothetical protein